jgi:predicted amidophosphoribosyltransferase
MGRALTLNQARANAEPRPRDFDRMMKSLTAVPQVLCWRCRKLTPFEVDQCEHCGSPFAGSTGGAYSSGRSVREDSSRPAKASGRRTRSLAEIVEDLRRIRELSESSRKVSRRSSQRQEGYLYRYQCPACARYVSEQATACACGVRFAVTFECPECASSVPFGRDACPVCRVDFRASGLSGGHVYMCPRCGSHVSADAPRCSCGARFMD